MDAFAGEILGVRVLRLEESIRNLSHGIQSLLDQQDSTLPSTLPQESGQLVDVVRTLAASTTSASSQINMASSNGAPTVIQNGNLIHGSLLAGPATEYSPSVHGVPITSAAQQQIRDWVSEISHNPAPAVGEISGALTEVSFSSEFVSTRFSPPSTVQQSSNFKAEITERRLKKINELMSQKKFEQAVPHLRRAIERIKSPPAHFTTDVKVHTLQLTLGKALFKSNLHGEEAEPLLRSVFDNEESSMTEKSTAAYYLACLLSQNNSPRLDEAKELCEFAAQASTDTLGRDDSKTYRSIATLVELCRRLQDPDEELWCDMLPKSFPVPPLRSLPQTLDGHSDLVTAVAFSPDGRLLAMPSGGSAVWLLDAGSGTVWKALEGHSSIVYAVAFSPDGKLLASASGDTTVRLWEAGSGMVRKTLEGHSSSVCAVAFSPDGKLLASASADKTIRLIIQHRMDLIPKTLNPTEVYQVARTADKYDCTSILYFAVTNRSSLLPGNRKDAGPFSYSDNQCHGHEGMRQC